MRLTRVNFVCFISTFERSLNFFVAGVGATRVIVVLAQVHQEGLGFHGRQAELATQSCVLFHEALVLFNEALGLFLATRPAEASTLSVFKELVLCSWKQFAHGLQVLHADFLHVDVELADAENLLLCVLSHELQSLQVVVEFARAERVLLQALQNQLFCALFWWACESEAWGQIL